VERELAALVVFVTAPGPEAAGIARSLVEEGLVACVNLVPGVRSIYRWQGRVCDEQECLLIAKTSAARFEALKARVVELHSYEVPEVIALSVIGGHQAYLAWVEQMTRASE
jgi:periplasmic divalent cation tolerance protein